jgi:hypothetical protein
MVEQANIVGGITLETEAPVCRHHWVIDSPSGPASRGVCKVCGAVKQFSNVPVDSVWDDTPLTDLFGPQWADLRETDVEYDS